MMRFMQEVYRRIRENNSAMLTDDNHFTGHRTKRISAPIGKNIERLLISMSYG